MRKFIVIAIIAIVAAGGWFVSQPPNNKPLVPKSTTQKARTFTVKHTITADKAVTQNVTAKEGETELEVLKRIAQIETKGEGEKAFITSINGRKADDAKQEFWAFYVNGQQAELGAGSYKVAPSDSIEWKIETY